MKVSNRTVLEIVHRPIVLVAIAFAGSFWLRWLALNQTPFGNGWDSYFYLVQLQSFLQEGKMHSPEWTLFYPILYFFNLFFVDPIISLKVTCAALAGTFSVIVLVMAKQLKFSNAIATLVVVYTWFSPELTYFAAQWPKNLLGVVLLFSLILSLLKGNIKWIVILLMLSFFGHRMTALLGVGCVFFWLIKNKLTTKIWIIGVSSLMVIILLSFIVPGLLNIKDLGRLQHLITLQPQLATISFYKIFGSEKLSIAWQIEIWLALIAFAGIIVKLVNASFQKASKPLDVLIVLLMIILWFPFYYWEISGAAYRFFHVGLLLIPIMILIISEKVSVPYAAFALIIIIAITSVFSWKSYRPNVHDPSYASYQMVAEKLKSEFRIQGAPELIIAHKALAEFITYTNRTDAMPWIPDYKISEDQLVRVAYLPYAQLFSFYTNQKPVTLGGAYYLVYEKDWQVFVSNLTEKENSDLVKEHLTWQNPNEVRPEFLRK